MATEIETGIETETETEIETETEREVEARDRGHDCLHTEDTDKEVAG